VRPLPVAYGLIGCFVVAERLLRHGAEARSWEEKPADRGTTRAIGRAFGTSLLALLAAPVLNRWRIGRLYGRKPAWGGVAIMVMGLAFRIWAARVLGASYTRTLRTGAQQHLVADGPYRLVRHPGYLGTLLLWLGAAIAAANGIVAATIAVAIGPAYQARIVAEEAMLAEVFVEDYESYTSHTWRLIPYVY
jgi:protein-S-isoprenylcysteine O-methyltransferase Ste14